MTRSRITAMTLGATLLALSGLLPLVAAPVPAKKAEGGKVELKDVSYADLGKAVKARRGNVVVVELWANY